MNLTGPQRNALLAMFAAHPSPYEVRGSARMPLVLVDAGIATALEDARKGVKRFHLTPVGIERATRLAARRLASTIERDAAQRRAATAQAAGRAAATPAAPPQSTGKPDGWPFPCSVYPWPPRALSSA